MDGEIQPDEVKELLDTDSDVCVVDIRNELNYQRAHIPGSTNLPFQRLAKDVERFEGCDHVVTVCPHGQASVQAARLIGSYEGFDGTVESMAGGLEAWEWEFDEGNGSSDDGATDENATDAPF
ncbi:rhodanese-like domain-containing protein [Haloarchaeobius sp. HME9146]|uniref:rhodanese-like domain-containing protein n=1 Tax=Haloarchaeobius sp. HME9146 TaxID=2978732 RepID=UPI0021BEC3C5|nr:rhodanese-like domain-containing protein [Haloarchaeobius sp. HME9146]MCT9095463.1 rhodanese-like domain-containing protein [Haloarchaeobius sp. HME9146]